MVIYPGALTLLAWIYYGQSSALIFAYATAGVIIISNLIESDLIYVSEGFPKMELILTTQNEKVVID